MKGRWAEGHHSLGTRVKGLKILAIKKKPKPQTKNTWICGYPAALIAIVGWLDFTKNKASNVVFHPSKKAGSHFMPSSWEPHHPTFPVGMQEGMAKSQGESLWEGPDSVGCPWLEENLMF